MALKVLKNHQDLRTCNGPVKASMAMRAFQISAAAMRTSVDDQWAFLEYVDAPQWVDLSLEDTLQGVEGDDPWFYQSHPYHEAPLEELGSLSDLQFSRSSFRKTIAESQVEEVIQEISERPPASILKMIPKKLGSAKIQGELNQMAKNQAWPRSKAKRVQLQPHKQILDEDENRPAGILDESTLDTHKTANHGGKVLSAKSGSSTDLISVLMDRVRISDGLSTPSKSKDFDMLRSSSPKDKAKDSVNKADPLEHSRLQTISSAYPHSYNDTDKVCSNIVKMEFRPQRQEKHTFQLKRSSEGDDTSVRSSEDTAQILTFSKRIVNKDNDRGGKHDQLEAMDIQACCTSPCMPEGIISAADTSSASFVFEGKEETSKNQKHLCEGIADKIADVSTAQPPKQKVLAFTRIKKSQRTTLRMSLPTNAFGKGFQSAKLDLVNSHEVKRRIPSKGQLQAKVAGTSKLEPFHTSTTEIKTGLPPKVVNYNQKEISISIRSSVSIVPATSSKSDNRPLKKSSKGPIMHDIKSRTYGDGDDLAALIAEHNRNVRVVPKYEPRRHSMKDIKEWEIRTGKQYYSLQPLEREKVNQEITAIKRSQCR